MTDQPATNAPSTDPATRAKRLKFRSWHRGFREMDLIMGSFADAHLAGMTEAELATYEALLDVPDWDVYGWLTGTKPVPMEWDGDMLRRVAAHVAANGASQVP